MTRGQETFTTHLDVQLDARATYTAADRKLELDAAMRVHALLGDLSFDVARINGVHDALQQRAAKLPNADPLRQQLGDTAQKVDEIRKKIVATKEGGAITGEERIREKAASLYGVLVFNEGRPADYYVARIDSLVHERKDVVEEFDIFSGKELKAINTALGGKKLESIQPITREAWDKANAESEGESASGGRQLRLSEIFGWR
jgi:hypothetical protein